MNGQKMNFIGVIGNDQKNMTFYMIKHIFVNAGFSLIYKNDKDSTVILRSNGDNQIGLINITPEDIKSISNLELNFNVIVYGNFDYDKKIDKYLIKFINNLKSTVILNIDDQNSTKVLKGNDKVIVMTYGLNNKATITASSLDINNTLNFNYCLQREITTSNNKKIEPLEFPLTLNLIGRDNIYCALAATSVALCYGIDIDLIRKSLLEWKGLKRVMEKVYHKDFIIIDNKCLSSYDYNVTFETIQHLKYKNIVILKGIEKDIGIKNIIKNLEIVKNWAPILGTQNILFFIDKNNKLIEENIKNLFEGENFQFNIYYSLKSCVKEGLKMTKKDDILLIIGGDILNNLKDILNNELTS